MFYKILLAFALVTGSGELVRASQNKPFYKSSADCYSVARALGHGATCKYVSVPDSLQV